MRRKKNKKNIEEVKEVLVEQLSTEPIEFLESTTVTDNEYNDEPVVVEALPVEEPIILNEMPILGHSHEDEPLMKHFMVLKSDLGYLPKVGDIVKYKGHECRVVRIKLNKIFLCRED